MQITAENALKETACAVPGMTAQAPNATAESRYMWRRFELTTSDPAQIAELEAVLDRHKDLTRRELAVIVMGLRVRPGFALKDFDI